MKASLKSAWIEALRSDKYIQTTGYLRRHTTPDSKPLCCCLGVLCEVAQIPRGYDGDSLRDAFFYGHGDKLTRLARSLPPEPEFRDLTALGELNLRDRDECIVKLTELNDYDHLSFAQIADLIEYFVDEEPDETVS